MVMASLGLLSGALSASLGFSVEPWWLARPGSLFFLDAGMVPIGAFFAAAVGVGLWIAAARVLVLPVVALVTLYAWSAAIHTATGIITTTSSDVRLLLGSLAAGAVGAGITHLGGALLLAELRRPRPIAVTTLIGALLGLIYYASERSSIDVRLLFLAWQPAVAFCIGRAVAERGGD